MYKFILSLLSLISDLELPPRETPLSFLRRTVIMRKKLHHIAAQQDTFKEDIIMANETRIFRIPPNMPVQAVASHVDQYLQSTQGLQVQGASHGEECVLQCRQEKDGWKTVTGMRLATTVQMNRTDPNTLSVTIGISEWSDKIGAGVAGMLLFWPLAVTAGIGAYKQKKLPEDIFRCIENFLLSNQGPSAKTAPQHSHNASGFAPGQQAPAESLQPLETPQTPALICPNCQTVCAPGSRFCNLCGTPLTKKTCPDCGSDIIPGSKFCAHCGKPLE